MAAAKDSLLGLTLDMLADHDEVARRLEGVRAANGQDAVVEGEHCWFELADWRIGDGSEDELTEKQVVPFDFSLRSGGCGPVATLSRKGGDEYTVAIEVDRGCAAIHVQGPASDNAIVTVRVADDGMQARLIDNHGRCQSFLVKDTIERTHEDYTLTQDGPEATEPRP